MTSITLNRSLILESPPSCIAYSPSNPSLFLVGTYNLHSKEGEESGDATGSGRTQERSGSLVLYELRNGEIAYVATARTPTFAVLDFQWSPHDSSLIAVATSTGSLAFYRISTTDRKSEITAIGTKQLFPSSILALSLAWHQTRADCIFVTLSDGRVCVCTSSNCAISATEAQIPVRDIYQHGLEAWCLAYVESHNRELLYSGGDDMVLQCSSLDPDTEETILLWQDRKLHAAGVTALLPLASDLLLTGSYDDHIRLISAPLSGRRKTLAEENLGGGVWRLKVLTEMAGCGGTHSSDGVLILASCMHAGTRVVRLRRRMQADEDEWYFEVVAKFEEHRSMNYGSDAKVGTDSVWTVVSTSFYDKLLCLWTVDASAPSRTGV